MHVVIELVNAYIFKQRIGFCPLAFGGSVLQRTTPTPQKPKNTLAHLYSAICTYDLSMTSNSMLKLKI